MNLFISDLNGKLMNLFLKKWCFAPVHILYGLEWGWIILWNPSIFNVLAVYSHFRTHTTHTQTHTHTHTHTFQALSFKHSRDIPAKTKKVVTNVKPKTEEKKNNKFPCLRLCLDKLQRGSLGKTYCPFTVLYFRLF